VLLRPVDASADKLSADGARDVLAGAIAEEIARLLGESDAALAVGPEGALRCLEPSDIYVLGRNGKDLDGVHDRLAARGIPCAYFKRHGLFATREAEDLLMVLRAVADPSERSHRLKAWLTPFFGLQLAELRGDESLHDDHPLVARLVRLRERCEVRDYAGFARELLHTSGLARRELFVEESARRLTNYQHLVDILLDTRARPASHGGRAGGGLPGSWCKGKVRPEVGDDIERVATEGSAVQLLTMHKSKGLEAEVVFVLGGLGSSERPGSEPRVRHVRGTREAWMRPLPAAVADDVTREQSEEDERLFYVALTRARSRLYLPFFGGDAAPGNGLRAASERRLLPGAGGARWPGGAGAQRAPAVDRAARRRH
jgi:exodeoxyribonuclease V beta subunit